MVWHKMFGTTLRRRKFPDVIRVPLTTVIKADCHVSNFSFLTEFAKLNSTAGLKTPANPATIIFYQKQFNYSSLFDFKVDFSYTITISNCILCAIWHILHIVITYYFAIININLTLDNFYSDDGYIITTLSSGKLFGLIADFVHNLFKVIFSQK